MSSSVRRIKAFLISFTLTVGNCACMVQTFPHTICVYEWEKYAWLLCVYHRAPGIVHAGSLLLSHEQNGAIVINNTCTFLSMTSQKVFCLFVLPTLSQI